MLYCLDDGTALLEGPAAAAGVPASVEAATMILPAQHVPDNEPATMILGAPEPQKEISNSIAVLPFVNMSPDAENEYFCDGLAEELLNALTKIEQLKVAARTSAFSFKGKNIDIAEIARDLGVNSILEGSVRKSGSRLRITVQLVNAADGYHLWSERYDREMRDIFEVQDEITLAVVSALKVTLFGEERSALLKKGTANAEAYELYMRGRYFWNRRGVADFGKAIEQFELAIKLDPGYALAYSGLADCLIFLGYYDALSPAEARPKAKAAVAKALEMDDSLAESQASMAMYKTYFDFDWKGGEQGLLKAIRLNPKLPSAHYWYCSLLNALGRYEESVEQGRLALGLDPLNLIVNGNVARGLCHVEKYEEAIELALKTLEIAPDFFFTHWVLGIAYMETGRMETAVDHFRKAAAASDILVIRSFLGFALAKAGRKREARQILDGLHEESKHKYISPLCLCAIYIGLGEIEAALDQLEKAWELRAIQLMWIKAEHIFDPLRSEPRFQEVYRQVALP